MKHATHLFALSFCLALAATPAFADDDCEVPAGLWQSRDAALQHAARQGWSVNRLKIDDGCYEIRGQDAQGRSFKAKLDPQTLRVVKMKVREGEQAQKHDRERRREKREQVTDPRPVSPSVDQVPAQRPFLQPGTTPSGQVE